MPVTTACCSVRVRRDAARRARPVGAAPQRGADQLSFAQQRARCVVLSPHERGQRTCRSDADGAARSSQSTGAQWRSQRACTPRLSCSALSARRRPRDATAVAFRCTCCARVVCVACGVCDRERLRRREDYRRQVDRKTVGRACASSCATARSASASRASSSFAESDDAAPAADVEAEQLQARRTRAAAALVAGRDAGSGSSALVRMRRADLLARRRSARVFGRPRGVQVVGARRRKEAGEL